jgi:hypothetical protein
MHPTPLVLSVEQRQRWADLQAQLLSGDALAEREWATAESRRSAND